MTLALPRILGQYIGRAPFRDPMFQIHIVPEGDCWGALLGNDLQDGYAGFGETIAEALQDLAMKLEAL